MKTFLAACLTGERSDMLPVWNPSSTAVCSVQCWSTALCTEGSQPCPVKGWEARAACREERMSARPRVWLQPWYSRGSSTLPRLPSTLCREGLPLPVRSWRKAAVKG